MIKRDEIRRPWGVQSYLHTGPASGRLLVLLHPLALAGQAWTGVVAELGDRPALMLDLRGHGDSAIAINAGDEPSFTVPELAVDVVALLDALAVDEFDLCGLSMGGSVGTVVAAEAGNRLRRLVLTDTTAWYGPDAAASWAKRAEKAANPDRRSQLGFQLNRWFTPEFQQADPAAVSAVCDIFVATPPATHVAACRALGALDSRDRLASITAPTLVITGESDYATPPNVGRDLADAIPQATFRLWPRARHFGAFESQRMRATVRTFLDEAARG